MDVIGAAMVSAGAAKEKTESTGKVSKMALARSIFAEELAAKGAAGLVRKDILARFMVEAGCTAAGANTYYNTLRDTAGLVKHKA
jgi:hypothetical protein